MRFLATPIAGMVVVEAEPHADARGLFARLYCPAEFRAAGLGAFTPTQVNLSRNLARHTLRGMHYQDPPRAEAKLIRAVRGAAFDVAVDLRPDSPTYRRWHGVELDEQSMRAVFLPEGCAHGFLTLTPDCDLLYHMGRDFEPGFGRGIRFDDPAIGIDWPAPPVVIDPRDTAWPLLEPA